MPDNYLNGRAVFYLPTSDTAFMTEEKGECEVTNRALHKEKLLHSKRDSY